MSKFLTCVSAIKALGVTGTELPLLCFKEISQVPVRKGGEEGEGQFESQGWVVRMVL